MPEEPGTATLEAPAPTQAAGLEVPVEGTPPDQALPETPIEGEEQAAEAEQRYEPTDEERDTPLAKALSSEAFRKAQSEFEKTRLKHIEDAVGKAKEDHEYTVSQLRTQAAQERQQAVQQGIAQAGIGELSKLFSAVAEGFDSQEAAGEFLDKVLANPKHAAWASLRSGAAKREGYDQGRGAGITQASTLAYYGLNAEQTRELERFVVVNLQPKLAEGKVTVEQAFQQQLEKRDEIMRADVEAKLEKLAQERAQAEEKANGRKEKAPPAQNIAGRAGGAGAGWRTKAEARALHVQDKITSAEMRRISNDPSIPEG